MVPYCNWAQISLYTGRVGACSICEISLQYRLEGCVSLHFAGIELKPDHKALLLQLEKDLGEVSYSLGDPIEADFAGVSKLANNTYSIAISNRFSGEPLACSLAHQLFYAWQFKLGFPLIKPINAKIPGHDPFSASLNRLVLDLMATDKAIALGFDHSFFFNRRYKEIKEFATKRALGQPLDDFHRLWFAVDLALALVFLSADSMNFLLSILRGQEDEAITMALQIINLIEKTGYSTPGRAFLAMAELNTFLHTWNYFPIHYGDKVISSAQQYETEFSNLRSLILGKAI